VVVVVVRIIIVSARVAVIVAAMRTHLII
jgi:hypothetical protein